MPLVAVAREKSTSVRENGGRISSLNLSEFEPSKPAGAEWWTGRDFGRNISGSSVQGDVFKISSTPLDADEQFVVKVMDFSQGPNQAEALREHEVLKALGKLVAVKTNNGKISLAMKHYPGLTLDRFLKKYSNQLTAKQRLNLCVLITKQFSELHKAGYIHADAHDQNCLVDYDKLIEGDENSVHLIDFGLAKKIENDAENITSMPKPLGFSSTQYPPEYFHQHKKNPRSFKATPAFDSYAMGAYIEGIFTQDYNNLYAKLDPLSINFYSNVPKNIQSRIQKIVARTQDFYPTKRPTFTQLEKDLESLLEELAQLEHRIAEEKKVMEVVKNRIENKDVVFFRKIENLSILFKPLFENAYNLDALQQTIVDGNKDIVLAIIDRADLDQLQQHHSETLPPIYLAAQFGRVDVVEAFIKKGVEFNQCCQIDKHVSNGDIKEHAFNGYSPLHIAAEQGNSKVVAALLKAGAKIQPNTQGKRSIYLANQKWRQCNNSNDGLGYKRKKYQEIIHLLGSAAKLQRAEKQLLKANARRYQSNHYAKTFRQVAAHSPELFAAYLKGKLDKKSSLPGKSKAKLRNLTCVACCPDKDVQKLLMPANARDRQIKFLKTLKESVDNWQPRRALGIFKTSKSKSIRKLEVLFSKKLTEKNDSNASAKDKQLTLDNLEPEDTNHLFEEVKLVLKTHQSKRFMPKFFSRSKTFCREQYEAAIALNESPKSDNAIGMKMMPRPM